MEGRRVTAAIKDRYQTIVPVGSIIAITYQSPRENHGESQMKQKKASFAGMLDQQMQMLSVGKEENSTFQISNFFQSVWTRPTLTGPTTSATGVSAVSCGGDTAFRHGTAMTVARW